ncbi:hypothetical protein VNI00_017482 [Paramarasmius palmivorus]|uniref:C2H2-type domain-containing protein n=1 Tax=Paramarasmius palmivorus TaxID=297713 RepID=A0AAW0B5D1_9AGAR
MSFALPRTMVLLWDRVLPFVSPNSYGDGYKVFTHGQFSSPHSSHPRYLILSAVQMVESLRLPSVQSLLNQTDADRVRTTNYGHHHASANDDDPIYPFHPPTPSSFQKKSGTVSPIGSNNGYSRNNPPRMTRMAQNVHSSSSSLQSQSLAVSPERQSKDSSKSPYIPPARKSRNTQINSPIQSPLGIPPFKRVRNAQEYTCPLCPWTQKKRKGLLRHVASHQRDIQNDYNLGWWCTGVLVEERANFQGLEDAIPYELDGRLYVGGCRANFSRRDGLKRHLENPKIPCVGVMPRSEWHHVRER